MITQTKSPAVIQFLKSLTEDEKSDYLIDLIRRIEGDEHLDGAPLAQSLRDEWEPIAYARMPKL